MFQRKIIIIVFLYAFFAGFAPLALAKLQRKPKERTPATQISPQRKPAQIDGIIPISGAVDAVTEHEVAGLGKLVVTIFSSESGEPVSAPKRVRIVLECSASEQKVLILDDGQICAFNEKILFEDDEFQGQVSIHNYNPTTGKCELDARLPFRYPMRACEEPETWIPQKFPKF